MRPRIKLTGIAEMRVELRTLADRVPDTARKTMHRSAEIIVEEARLNVPEDIGNLKNAIKIIKDYAGIRGRLQIDIGIVPDGTEVNINGKPIDVMQYAAIIHENYESMTPGKRTLAKRSANPNRYIGSGFLRRAAAEEEPKLSLKTIAAIDRTIKEVQS